MPRGNKDPCSPMAPKTISTPRGTKDPCSPRAPKTLVQRGHQRPLQTERHPGPLFTKGAKDLSMLRCNKDPCSPRTPKISPRWGHYRPLVTNGTKGLSMLSDTQDPCSPKVSKTSPRWGLLKTLVHQVCQIPLHAEGHQRPLITKVPKDVLYLGMVSVSSSIKTSNIHWSGMKSHQIRMVEQGIGFVLCI